MYTYTDLNELTFLHPRQMENFMLAGIEPGTRESPVL